MKKGISIHIGLDYNGTLPTCGKDALDMQEIATSQNFETQHLLLNEEATTSSVIELITVASETLVSGDMLFISYSGHGSYVVDSSGDGDEEKDQVWCLHDRYFLDDELYTLWTLFEEGVRIFVVSDSCHSGTVIRVAPSFKAVPISKYFPHERAQEVYVQNKGFFSALKVKLSKSNKEEVKASVKLIAGCQDIEESFIAPDAENSLLTSELNKVWDTGQFVGTTVEFFEKVKGQVMVEAKKMNREQTPNLYTIGKENESFDKQKPFSIYE
jgi:hypothetical protein